MKKLFLANILAACFALSQAWAANPDIKISEPGNVTIPFTANITSDIIKTQLKSMLGPAANIDENLLEKKIGDSIREKIKHLKETAPDIWGVDEAEIVKTIESSVNTALSQIREAIQTYNTKVDEACGSAADKAKQALDAAAPAVEISSNYVYSKGAKDPGDPGWVAPQSNFDTQAITGEAGLDLKVTVVLDPEVLGNKVGGIEFDVIGHAKVSVSLEPNVTGMNISPLNQPSAEASAIPKIKGKYAVEAQTGAILYFSAGASVTKNHDAGSRIKGTITAGVEE